MDAVRTYEKRRDAAGNRTSIPDKIKTAALKAMLPPDLESHVQLNQARFTTFDELLEEITRYVEHKTGKSLKMVFAASTLANQNSLVDPMDVSSVGHKGGKKGSGNKFLGACQLCGKTGHKAAECWAQQGQKEHAPSYSTKARTEKGPGNT